MNSNIKKTKFFSRLKSNVGGLVPKTDPKTMIPAHGPRFSFVKIFQGLNIFQSKFQCYFSETYLQSLHEYKKNSDEHWENNIDMYI